MSSIETALLSSISHDSNLHAQWSRLIAQATPATTNTNTNQGIAVASPQRTKIAAWT